MRAVIGSGILNFCDKYLRKVKGIITDLDAEELMQFS
jgi:hypothetical protein